MKFSNKKNNSVKKAFTMAEAILVMTILGIIATIMITTLKPAKFKDKGLKILYKKVLAEIDTATTQILIKNSATGKMNSLFLDNESTTFTFNSDLTKTTKLYKKYLASTRKQYDTTKNLGTFSKIVQQSSTSATLSPPFYLKDGALIFLGAGEKYQLDSSQSGNVNVEGCEMPKSLLGIMMVDINGEEKPNTLYKDQFLLPIGKNGIEYEAMCDTTEIASVAPTPDPTPTPTPEPEPEPEEPQEYPCTDEGYDAFCKQMYGENAFYDGSYGCEYHGSSQDCCDSRQVSCEDGVASFGAEGVESDW